MATQKINQRSARQSPANRGGADSYYIPPPNAVVNKTDDHSNLAFLIILICGMLILPLFLYLMASMYFDMLTMQKETKQQQVIIRRLINELKEKE